MVICKGLCVDIGSGILVYLTRKCVRLTRILVTKSSFGISQYLSDVATSSVCREVERRVVESYSGVEVRWRRGGTK